jgi:hypothetical protein
MWGSGRRRSWIAAAVIALLLAFVVPTVAQARTINIREAVRLHLVRKSGNTLYESGTATGTLPGNVSARFEVSLTRVTGTVTIYPRGGSLTISVSGRPRSSGVNARFGGSMRVVRGTGKYRGASGSGQFEGVVNRRSWAAAVNATARLTY